MARIETKHLRWLTIVVLAGWLGCGGRVVDEPPVAEPLTAAPRPGSRTQPPSSALPRSEPAALPAVAPAPAAVPRSDDECSCLTGAVENVLAADCGQCHGPLAPVAASGGITFINDLDRLIAAGLLVPLNSAASPIVIAMVNGSMPPPGSGLPPVTDADINTVAQYLDNPRWWPLLEPTVRDAGSSPPVKDAGTGLPNRDASGDRAP